MTAKPKVVIIGTGGTIAGRAASATDLAYDAAQLSVGELLAAIPGLKNIADISATNLFSLNSMILICTRDRLMLFVIQFSLD